MKLIGLARQGNDAEIRYTQDGTAVASVSLAFSYGRKGEDGRRPTQWVDAALWGQRAEALQEWLTKGRLWYVELADVHIETYEGRNGQGHKLVGRIDNIEFAGGNDGQQQGGQQQSQQRQQQRPQQGQGQQRNGYADATGRAQPQGQRQQGQRQSSNFDDMSDDIPF